MTHRALAQAGLVVSGAFLISRILGWIRVAIIAITIGAGPELDAFFAAFRLPDLIFQLVAAGALSSALIPIVAGLLTSEDHQRAWRVVSTVTNLMLAALVLLAGIIFLTAPAIVPAITPGFDAAQAARTADLTRIMVLGPIFLALGSVATSLLNAQGRFAAAAVAPIVYNLAIIGAALLLTPSLGVTGLALGSVATSLLNAQGRFAAAAVAPIVYNLAIIGAALLLTPSLGVTGLAIGVVAGSIGHLLVQLPAVLRLGFRYTRLIDLADPQARKALALMAPRAIGLGATQITFVVVTSIASTLQEGSISAFNIAFTLLQIPIGVIGVPLGVVVFPALSREAALGRAEEFAALLSRAVRLLLFVMLPITGIGIVLRREVTELLFGYGKFDAAAIDLTAATLFTFMFGLAAHALIAVLARAFYARQDTRTPVAAGIIAVVVNTTLSFALAGPFGLPGIGLAIAIGAWLEMAILLVLLRRRLSDLSLGPIFLVGIRSLLASVVAAAVAFALRGGLVIVGDAQPSTVALLVRVVLVGGVALGVYAVLAAALRIPELPSIVGVMADLLRRPRRA